MTRQTIDPPRRGKQTIVCFSIPNTADTKRALQGLVLRATDRVLPAEAVSIRRLRRPDIQTVKLNSSFYSRKQYFNCNSGW